MAWNTIFVAYDFSSGSERALGLACELAAKVGARVVLGHVTTLPAGFDVDTPVQDRETGRLIPAEDLARTSALRQLDEAAEQLNASGVSVESLAAIGEVVPGILALAAQCGAQVIAMGTHGRSGLEHLLLGSVAEKVIRASPIPVLTTRGEGASEAERTPRQPADERDD